MNELDQFVKQYEAATNSHNFDTVEPLIAKDAVYWFSDGSFEGHQAIRKAFESAWDTVKNEVYTITNVRWLAVSDTVAVCVYDFTWKGEIDGAQKSGGGRGTNALTKTATGWQIVHEHLSKYPEQS